jgi:hypothetical protein
MSAPRKTADPAVRAGLEAVGLYDRVGTVRLGHDVADCPVHRDRDKQHSVGQMMRVDGWRFHCYAQCTHDEVADRLASDERFLAAVRKAS